MDCKEIQLVHSEDQPWDFFGRNDAKAEAPVLWPPHAKSWLIGKDSDAGRDWRQEEKGTTEDEMAGWRHWLNGRESEWTPGVGDGQGGLACCDSWGRKESDTTERLNWTEMFVRIPLWRHLVLDFCLFIQRSHSLIYQFCNVLPCPFSCSHAVYFVAVEGLYVFICFANFFKLSISLSFLILRFVDIWGYSFTQISSVLNCEAFAI